MCWITLIKSWMLNQPWISGINQVGHGVKLFLYIVGFEVYFTTLDVVPQLSDVLEFCFALSCFVLFSLHFLLGVGTHQANWFFSLDMPNINELIKIKIFILLPSFRFLAFSFASFHVCVYVTHVLLPVGNIPIRVILNFQSGNSNIYVTSYTGLDAYYVYSDCLFVWHAFEFLVKS